MIRRNRQGGYYIHVPYHGRSYYDAFDWQPDFDKMPYCPNCQKYILSLGGKDPEKCPGCGGQLEPPRKPIKEASP